MRSIGAGSSTVALQFLTEGLVVGFISWVVGLPIAALVQLALLEVTQLRETFGFQFDYEGALLALVGVMIITTIASLWPSLSAARRTVSDILRYQ
jgi:ABC-type antimicrobial peptide transport system permease subunit